MEHTEPKTASPDFSTVPALIREHGRARGFERLRDIVLDRPEAMGSESLLPVLKLVIELDRHALFSSISESKAKERDDQERWSKFQEYLKADDVALEKTPKPKGRKRNGKQKADSTSIRESESVLRVLRGTDPAGAGYQGPEGGLPESGDSQSQ